MATPKKNFYVDKNHPENGVYKSWDDARAAKEKGGTNFHGFVTLDEAKSFMAECLVGNEGKSGESWDKPAGEDAFPTHYAFTDGSFNEKTGVYGYGGFVVSDGEKYPISGSGNDPEAAVSRNVAGEVLGAMAAVKKAAELNLNELTIYYDYEGIRAWALGQWKTNKRLTAEYADFMKNCGLAISFIHVKAHTGIDGNEEADRMAKEAVGLANQP